MRKIRELKFRHCVNTSTLSYGYCSADFELLVYKESAALFSPQNLNTANWKSLRPSHDLARRLFCNPIDILYSNQYIIVQYILFNIYCMILIEENVVLWIPGISRKPAKPMEENDEKIRAAVTMLGIGLACAVAAWFRNCILRNDSWFLSKRKGFVWSRCL